MSEDSRAVRPDRRFVSLRTKLLLGAVLIIALLMVTVMAIVERRQRATIIEEVHRRGAAQAESLAAISVGPLLLYNFTALEQNVARVDGHSDDIHYAIVLDLEGRVAAHSRQPGRVGSLLDDPVTARAVAAAAPLVQETTGAEGEPLYDFAVPIFVERQRWGTVRVGLSRSRMEAEIAKTRRELALLTAVAVVLGGLAAALVARRIVHPVRQLAAGAAAISRGELDRRITPVTSDEIGGLAEAFNDMANQLGQQRTQIESAHAELRRRFGELSDLKSYTDHILGSLTSGIITLDLEGRVVTLNAAAETLTGCPTAEVRGRPCREALAHLPDLCQLLVDTVTSRVGTSLAAVSLARRGDGPAVPAVPIEVTTAPLKGAEGQGLGVIAVLRDVTAVRQLEEQLRRSDRLAALGTLAAGLAHEIKNPLTAILTFSRHLPRRFGDERFRQRFQNVVPRELERINGIVDGLLRLARPSRLTLAPVHLPDLLDSALELYGQQIEARRVTVTREYTLGLPALAGDPEHLYQALVNLITNALDAMAEGGALTVRVGWREPGDAGVAGGRREREGLRVEVEDTGAGITGPEAAHVFNPFFTTKPTGTGLGLAIAHKIVEDHGGTITFRSAPGRGTTFVVLLPLVTLPRVERIAGDLPAERSRPPQVGGA